MDFFKGLLLDEVKIRNYFMDQIFRQQAKTTYKETFLPTQDKEDRRRKLESDAKYHMNWRPAPYKQFKDYGENRIYFNRTLTADYKKNTDRLKLNQYKLETFVYRVYKLILTYCPIDTGELRSSFRIERSFGASNRYVIFTKCKYASAVHEMFGYRHDYPTCANYVARAVFEVSSEYGNPYNVYLDLQGTNGLYLYINDYNFNLIKGSQPSPNSKELEQGELIIDNWINDEFPKELLDTSRFDTYYRDEKHYKDIQEKIDALFFE